MRCCSALMTLSVCPRKLIAPEGKLLWLADAAAAALLPVTGRERRSA